MHRATFLIAVDHDETYTAISNTAFTARVQLEGNRVRTSFSNTQSLSPSSLAFFVSGFTHEERETIRGIKHIVSVRQTESDYTEKLFVMTATILQAVESFMNAEFPDEILRSVALPNFDNDVSAFQAFNYYRFVFVFQRFQLFTNIYFHFPSYYSEDLIVFNPAVSPLSKEFSISKLITSGMVSQFLGNIVSLNSWNDAWIFKGLSKFLEYEINDDEFKASEMFISEVLHPTLHRTSYSSELPFSADDALSQELIEKGEKLQFAFLLESKSFNVISLDVKNLSSSRFSFQLLALFE